MLVAHPHELHAVRTQQCRPRQSTRKHRARAAAARMARTHRTARAARINMPARCRLQTARLHYTPPTAPTPSLSLCRLPTCTQAGARSPDRSPHAAAAAAAEISGRQAEATRPRRPTSDAPMRTGEASVARRSRQQLCCTERSPLRSPVAPARLELSMPTWAQCAWAARPAPQHGRRWHRTANKNSNKDSHFETDQGTNHCSTHR